MINVKYFRYLKNWISLGIQICIIVAIMMYPYSINAQELKFRVGKIAYTGVLIDELLFEASGEPEIQKALIQLKELKLASYSKSNLISPLMINCSQLKYSADFLDCKKGFIQLKQTKIPLQFVFNLKSKALDLSLMPSSNETWNIKFQQYPNKNWDIHVDLKNANLQRLIPYLTMPKQIQFKQGIVSGFIKLKSKNNKIVDVISNIDLSDINFSDEKGFNAGEKLKLNLDFNSTIDLNQHNIALNGTLKYLSGQAYFQPIYFDKGGHQIQFSANYQLDKNMININNLETNLANIGKIFISNTSYDLAKNQLSRLQIAGNQLDFKSSYQLLFQPFLADSSLGKLKLDELQGKINLNALIQNNQLNYASIQTEHIDLIDSLNRFYLKDVNILIPFDKHKYNQGYLKVKSAGLKNLPFGEINTTFDLNQNKNAEDIDISMSNFKLSLLNSEMDINDFKAIYYPNKTSNDNLEWQFQAELKPISMTELTKAFEITSMNGDLSAKIPKISYKNHEIKIDGELQSNLFDGSLKVKDIQIFEPFGKTSRVLANVDLKNIDLDLLTRSFQFGNITGKIDVSLANLELNNWKPANFDLKIMTSEGNFKKRLSQRAVENIASLNGGGFSSAIQRSAMRFFDSFGYSKIGLSCEMRFGLCKMSGVESAENNGYVIIKGSGIPNINIIGYNKLIDWEDLVNRIQTVIEAQKENQSPEIK